MERFYYKSKDGTGFLNLKSPLNDENYIQITEEEFEELSKPKVYESTEEQKAKIELAKTIREKKALLNEYREDVEQVDLFGMERNDYSEKKELCKQLVYELRELEKNQLLTDK